jgi:hypothetical protein
MIDFNCDEPDSPTLKTISEDAKNMVRSLIVAEGEKRITIQKLKKHPFFAKIRWDHAEKGQLKMPVVKLKKPKAENFDEIQYDSDDQDFIHELEGMTSYDLDHRTASNGGVEEPGRQSEASAMYNYTAQERKQMQEGIRDSFEHLIVDQAYFDEQGRVKIPGFSFHGQRDNGKQGFIPPPSNNDGRPSELVYMNNWNRETST